MPNTPLFPDDNINPDVDFIPFDVWSITQFAFPRPVDILFLIIGVVAIGYLSFRFVTAPTGNPAQEKIHRKILDYFVGSMVAVTFSLFALTFMMLVHIPQIANHNVQEVIPNYELTNDREVYGFFERIPEYKEKLNPQYDPERIKVYETDGTLTNSPETKFYVFMDHLTGTTSVRILTPDTLERLEETHRDSIIR